jgi:hypothetical protein
MALETGTNISDLTAANPTSGDNASQGDDHLRLIKTVLKTEFPSFVSSTTGVVATQAELSVLGSVTAGTVSASDAVVVDASSKVDVWNVDNITLNGNTITTTDTNGDLLVAPNGTGDVDFDACSIMIDTGESIKDAGGDEYIEFTESTTPVNHLGVESADTGVNIKLKALGEADSGIIFENDQSEELMIMECVATAVNEITITNAATGANPVISATGEADSGIDFENDQSEELFIMEATASAVNEFTSNNAATGAGPSLSATGGDTNVDINLIPKGTGGVNIQGTLITSETTTLSGAGAIPITGAIAELTSGAADVMTVADGVEGQRLTCVHVTDGGSCIVTPANRGGYATVTLTAAGDTCELLFTNSAWYVTAVGGITPGVVA